MKKKHSLLLTSILIILFDLSKGNAQNNNVDSVIFESSAKMVFVRGGKLLINPKFINFCNKQHSHDVDVEAKRIIDSLILNKVDTILFYRHWIGTNGFNGYGKIFWIENGFSKAIQLNYDALSKWGEIVSVDSITRKESDKVFSFYFENRIDTIESLPKGARNGISHDSDHFIYMRIKKREICFSVSGEQISCQPTHKKSQLIYILKIQSKEYFDMLDKRAVILGL